MTQQEITAVKVHWALLGKREDRLEQMTDRELEILEYLARTTQRVDLNERALHIIQVERARREIPELDRWHWDSTGWTSPLDKVSDLG